MTSFSCRAVLPTLQKEYSALPTLRLTTHQAARLCNGESQVCQMALDVLVRAGVLVVDNGAYIRAGAVASPGNDVDDAAMPQEGANS
jgi:hypothetical protein